MQFTSIALAAAVAAQSSGVNWVPLGSQGPTAQQPTATVPSAQAAPSSSVSETTAPTVTVATPTPEVQTTTPPTSVPAPTAAIVPDAPKGVILWRNVEDGMPVSKLRAMFPQGPKVEYKSDRTVLTDVPIIEGCEAKVNILHPAGQVKEIVMRGEGSLAGRCSLKIITALSGKYGEPLEKDKVKGSLFAREGKNYVWSRDGIALQFKRYTNGALGGGGLFSASWELRYSVNPTNIDL